MTALPPQVAARCAKIIGQLASDSSHIRLSAADALQRTLSSAGCGISDLAERIVAPPAERVAYHGRPETQRPRSPAGGPTPFDDWRRFHRQSPLGRHRAEVTRCRAAGPKAVSTWEWGFLASIAGHLDAGRSLTDRQAASLRAICERLDGGRAC